MKKQFKTEIYPMSETIFCIDVISVNYHANINTTLLVDVKSRQIVDSFKCNVFVDARKFIKDLANDIKVTLKSDLINKFGQI